MIKQLVNIVVKAPIAMQARVTVDTDTDAERVILMHRNTGDLYHMFKVVSPVTSFTVPYSHAVNDTLLVGILDDNHVYNCKFVDGVRAENINANAI
ncbi:MAG: hypothetical protein KJ856_14040 [Gammaproteobacteria bacterium]|uniref:Uncharacterized protein n=1 Tax=viral metagenome TaxID=1070528 RepID=A0A6M3XET3_9ZZZZ|nr:hypothetical protein [Gammaproteobacteria bacterium]MBU1479230.1 hypothetical protein [Gammaproteobacteria bacterium]MBU2003030.1 hypothetical protein [Gammaproteobacteria bacterium]MBU2134146.1 hypothetical protein [Gammaproteobacteria bacterium]MBU2188110.1 hypothetical protein [Gammaproteobacteria bacterium]